MTTEQYFETQDLTVEIDTGDASLSTHSSPLIWYIFTDPDGTEAAKASKAASVVSSTVLSAALDPLMAGTYRIWCESVTASGKKCVSPAFTIPAAARGTVRA